LSQEYVWLNELSQQFLEKDYLLPGQTLPERVSIIRGTFAKYAGDSRADKFVDYYKKGFYSLATPIQANYGTDRGLPISCNGSYAPDTMKGISYAIAEIAMMSKYGAGTSIYLGDLRHRGAVVRNNGFSSGPVHFASWFDRTLNVANQGGLRRGNGVASLPVDHPNIEEFLTIRSEGSPIQDLSFGVCVPNYWMREMIGGDVDKRKIWVKVLQSRANTGYPYIFFTDNANDNSPYTGSAYRINSSNLCQEVCLPANDKESFVCCLASMNILHFDEWKYTDAVEILTWFLDSVLEEYITRLSAPEFDDDFMGRALLFAKRHRAIGIGWLGWHSYLQSKSIPFESFEAKLLNVQVAQVIQEKSYKASEEIGAQFGVPEVCRELGLTRRNTTCQAIAPTKSSAFIFGQVSEGIEPHRSNIVVKALAKGQFTIKNKHLEALLESKGENTPEVWSSILKHAGSVQHLDILNDHEKSVFKTFQEISPKEVIIQAAARQKFIDQGQSLNLLIHPSVPVKDVNALMIFAWEQGIKSLYYQFSVNAAQEASRDILTCASCES
jgi:ribonucleoside-diphosphate reductase alpha chain